MTSRSVTHHRFFQVVLDAELNAKLCDLGITEFGIPDDGRRRKPCEFVGRIRGFPMEMKMKKHVVWQIGTSLYYTLNFTLDAQNIVLTPLDLGHLQLKRLLKWPVKWQAHGEDPHQQAWRRSRIPKVPLMPSVFNGMVGVGAGQQHHESCPSQKINIKHIKPECGPLN